MGRYRVIVCREVWGYVDVDAESSEDAVTKVEEGDYDGEFVQTKIGDSQTAYSAEHMREE